jgi:hypothetical protein
MSKTTRDLMKNVIEENAVEFKKNMSEVLYDKVGKALSEKYVEMSKVIFENINLSEQDGYEPVGPPSPQPTNPQPVPVSPGGQQGQQGQQPPVRPIPTGFKDGNADPAYRDAWYEYYKWWVTQPEKWKQQNPMPSQPRRTRPG